MQRPAARAHQKAGAPVRALARSAAAHFLLTGVVFRSARANKRGWAPSTAFLTNPTFFAMPWATSKGGGALSLSSSAAGRGRGGVGHLDVFGHGSGASRGARASVCAVLARGVRRSAALASLKGADSL